MKNLLTALFLLFTFSLFSQGYKLSIKAEEEGFSVKKSDPKNAENGWVTSVEKSGLDTLELLEVLYGEVEYTLNQKAIHEAAKIDSDKIIEQLQSKIVTYGGNYSAWAIETIKENKAFDGVYFMFKFGEEETTEFRIEGVEAFSSDTGQKIFDLFGNLSANTLNLKGAGGTLIFYKAGGSLYISEGTNGVLTFLQKR